jgi:hypothetical protein
LLGNGVSDSATSYRLRSKRLSEACAAELRENAEASSSDAGKGDKERRSNDGRRGRRDSGVYICKCSYILLVRACVTPRNNFNLEIWTRGDKTR